MSHKYYGQLSLGLLAEDTSCQVQQHYMHRKGKPTPHDTKFDKLVREPEFPKRQDGGICVSQVGVVVGGGGAHAYLHTHKLALPQPSVYPPKGPSAHQ